jgi:hypothetical protein
MLAYDPAASSGINLGFGPDQLVGPGQRRIYTFYAHPEVGPTTALIRDYGDVWRTAGLGLYGAIVVAPAGASFTHPETGADLSQESSWRADVRLPDGTGYRDFTLLFQDEDEIIGTAIMPYTERVRDVVGLNYQTESLYERLEDNADPALVFNVEVHGDPATPRLEAYAGDSVRIHLPAPSSEQAHVFSVEGHQWPLEPGRPGSDFLSSVQLGSSESVDIYLWSGVAEGVSIPGDYLYGDHREPYREAGLWGLLRVHSPGAAADILPLASP